MTERRRLLVTPLFVAIAMLLLPCSTVLAAELRGVAKACVGDVKTQCAGVKPGEGRIRECIKTHVKDLSEPCQKFLLKAVTVKTCASDVKQNCAGTKPGGGRIQACMKAHLADVSEPCKEALARSAAGRNN
jgi:hypothetical protein